MTEAIVIEHPLVQDKFSLLRDKHTHSGDFRTLLADISQLIFYEATKNLATHEREIETPLNVKVKCPVVKSNDLVLISVLRAGYGMLDGILKLCPSVRVGHLGLYRDPKTYAVIEYYCKIPPEMHGTQAFILDPIIATGNSASAAIAQIKEAKPKSIVFLCVVASPEGLAYVQSQHPDVAIYAAKIDDGLDARNFIVPGLGDAGDRMFGTT